MIGELKVQIFQEMELLVGQILKRFVSSRTSRKELTVFWA
jgi:hypothetical protein